MSLDAAASEPCDHDSFEACGRCDPLSLTMWGRLPLGLTIHLREATRAYREKPGVPDA